MMRTRSPARVWLAPGSVLGLALAFAIVMPGHAAFAATPPSGALEDDLVKVEAGVTHVQDLATAIRQQTAAGEDVYGTKRALDRYQDAVVRFMLEDYQPAAEAFFALVTTRALDGIGLGWDAEWYLAESLFFLGNDDLAVAAYQEIAADPKHPFREDGVRRLLEIYSRDADAARFDDLYTREILRGKVQPTDVILYSVGRAFHTKGDRVKSKGYFNEIAAESPYWARAQYQLGAMLVEEGTEPSMRDAVVVFSRLGAFEAVTFEDMRVVDLAWLAVGRIFEHQSEWRDAAEAYSKVGDDSAYAPDKLREIAWVYIQAKDYPAASAAVDVFLERFPNHAYAAELRLVQGHLQFQQAQWDRALTSYQSVVADYTPVREKFTTLSRPEADANALFNDLLGDDADGVWAPKDPEALPPFAVALLVEDPQFSRALNMYRDLQKQEAAIVASEAIIASLTPALGGSADTSAVTSARYSVLSAQVTGINQGIALLDVETRWLALANAPSGRLAEARANLDALRGRIAQAAATVDMAGPRNSVTTDATQAAVLDNIEKPSTLELGGIEADLERVRKEIRALRAPSGIDADMDPTSTRLDAQHATLSAAITRVREVGSSIASLKATDLERLRATFREQVDAVQSERAELDARYATIRDLAVAVARNDFARLSGEFLDSILGADMGIVNVHWSRWVADGDEQKAVTEERNDAVSEVEAQYQYLQRGVTK